MDGPVFDIFRGPSDQNAVWVEAVVGLSQARKRMEEIAAAKPGEYFIFGSSSHSILARIDTRRVWPLEQGAKSA
jgi:hypothetical protein